MECSTPDDLTADGHLCPRQVGDLARNTRPGRVVLTHMYPPVADRQPELDVAALAGVECDAARDGDIFTVPRETEPSS